jgi:hypothetical protein
MLVYRIYALKPDGHIAGPPTDIECVSDEEAIKAAKALKDGLDLEVWQAARRVAQLPSKSE